MLKVVLYMRDVLLLISVSSLLPSQAYQWKLILTNISYKTAAFDLVTLNRASNLTSSFGLCLQAS